MKKFLKVPLEKDTASFDMEIIHLSCAPGL